jgi:hypothetical protein
LSLRYSDSYAQNRRCILNKQEICQVKKFVFRKDGILFTAAVFMRGISINFRKAGEKGTSVRYGDVKSGLNQTDGA